VALSNPFAKLSHRQLIAVLIGGGAIAAYAEYRHHASTGSWSPFASASAAASQDTSEAASGTGTVTDPTTGQEYSDTAVDPSTQLTYASEISQYGSVTAAEADVSQFGTSSNLTGEQTYDSDYVGQQSTDQTTTTSGTTVYTSNSAWAQAVQAGLQDVSGSTSYDGTDIGTALGAYLQGEPLSTAQGQLISTARAEYGPPPIGNLQIILQPTTTSSSTPPPVTTAKATSAYPAPSGLKVTHASGSTYKLTWTLLKGTTSTGPTPTSYTIAAYPASGGNSVVYQTVSVPDTQTGGSAEFTLPAKAGVKYNAEVWANGNTGIAPKHATTTITVE
jgi:hypothetical protein